MPIPVNDDFFLDRDKDGREIMVLRRPWNPNHRDAMARLGIQGLRLSESAGWKETNLDFLSSLKELRSLEIYSQGITDLEPVARLHALEMIGLYCPYKKNFDFSAFKQLKTLLLNWRSGAETLARCNSLQLLNVINYPLENLQHLSQLSGLKTLKVTSSKLKTLEGVEFLSDLLHLDLYRCTQLAALTGIESNPSLLTLHIDCCKKIVDLRPLQSVSTLQEISLEDCGTLDSLAPLKSLHSLRKLFFVGTTAIADGDISLFKSLPMLRAMGFMNRKGYSHTREQIGEFLATR